MDKRWLTKAYNGLGLLQTEYQVICKKSVILILSIYFSGISLSAQNSTGKIEGFITDEQGKVLHSVSVSLLRSRDSLLVKLAVTGKDGRYLFENIRNGEYVLMATHSGYQKKYSMVFRMLQDERETIMLPAIQLAIQAKNLSAVTIISEKQLVEIKADKTIINVDASPSNAGATALEVLEKSPGITLSNEGQLSLRGKTGVLVMLDGKPSYLSPADLTVFLRNMPASAIEQIEIMTNPSAKYDAEGNGGVINIKTKKGRTPGLNGSFMAGINNGIYKNRAGTYYLTTRLPGNLSLNYKKGKINLYANYNPNIIWARSNLLYVRTKLDPAKVVTGINETLTNFHPRINNHSVKFGMDILADRKNSFGLVISATANKRVVDQNSLTTMNDPGGNLISVMNSGIVNTIYSRNMTANFNYRHVFDSAGKEISADADYIFYDNLSKSGLETDFFNNTGQVSGPPLQLNGRLPGSIAIYSLKTDYIHPISKNLKFETGAKSSLVKNNNLVDYTRWDGNGWVRDSRSNHFLYEENINAVYFNISRQFNKLSLQAGLRLENTRAKGYQVTNDSSFARDFTNLFPSAFASYTINKSHSFSLALGRRIARPNYQDLNPFLNFLDSISFQVGNPFLQPQFSNNAELSYSYKGRITASVNYTKTKNVFTALLTTDDNVVYLQPRNLAGYRNIGLALTSNLPVTKKWNSNVFVNVFNNRYRGVFNSSLIDISYTQVSTSWTQTFTVKPGFTLELSGIYRTGGVNQLVISHPIWALHAGLQKQVLKGKGTVRLNVRDIFWTQKFSGYQDYELVRTTIDNTPDTRQVTTTFTLRFGKANQQGQPRRRNTAPLEEQNRAGQ